MKHVAITFVLLAVISLPGFGQQQADPEFNTTVANPAYNKNGPRVMFDEAHHNFHTSDGRYKPFVDLMSNDGYRIVRNRQPFTKATLSGFKVLVIANALGAEELDDEGADQSAFTEAECDVVKEWVKDGGALLLIADHAPAGGAAAALGNRFGVDMSKGFTYDPNNSVPNIPSLLIFSRENKLLATHPITEGRNQDERVNKIWAFTGQSLKGPANSAAILMLSETATDKASREAETSVSAAGRAQAVALKFGKGRVVVQGEAAMLSAQLAGPNKEKMGMNAPGIDNRQYALNLMHWLSGLLKEK
jgi:hypothetical protein